MDGRARVSWHSTALSDWISLLVSSSYGTPFLLGLGLSEHVTSLVWLAGPISGLIAQPVIGQQVYILEAGIIILTILLTAGVLSDSSTSKYRRRYWIILSTVALVISTFTLAYCQELAAFIVDIFAVGAGDWDKERNKRVL